MVMLLGVVRAAAAYWYYYHCPLRWLQCINGGQGVDRHSPLWLDGCVGVGVGSWQGSVSCQSMLGKYADGNSTVTAATFTNTPSYNAQCGVCLRVTNLDYGGPQVRPITDTRRPPPTHPPFADPFRPPLTLTTGVRQSDRPGRRHRGPGA